MPTPPNYQFVTHTFAGGWATDFGPNYYGGPDQSGMMAIPFLINAKNVIYELDGGPHKCPGTTALNASVIGSATTTVEGLYDYWKFGTAGTPVQKRIVYAGTTMYADAADGVFVSKATGMPSDAVVCFSTFNDLLIVSFNDTTQVPQQYDQTTWGNLTGSPPRFSFSVKHKNKQWAAGDWTKPYRLYYSVDNNPQDWTSAGSGSIDIDLGDGDMITGLASYKDQLWVFKGPYKMSIHTISGSSPTGSDAYSRQTFTTGVSAVWQNAIFPWGDDLGFMSPYGSVHSVRATAAYGNYNQIALSFPIASFVRDQTNQNRLKYAWAVDSPENGRVLITLPQNGSNTNNAVLSMDYRFGVSPPSVYPRWSLWDSFSWASLARVYDSGSKNRPITMAGTYTGLVVKGEQVTRTNNGASINDKVTFPFLTYGSEIRKKTLEKASIGVQPKNANNITIGWTTELVSQQTTTVAQGGSDTLG